MSQYSEDSRAYVHARCEQATIVGDQAFANLSNPLSTTTQTYCSSCKAMYPIKDFRWADTQESLPDYYARHSATATRIERLLASNGVTFSMLGLSFVAGAAIAWKLWPIAQHGFLGTMIMMFGVGFIFTIVLGSLYLFGLMPLIYLRVCGYRDTRKLR